MTTYGICKDDQCELSPNGGQGKRAAELVRLLEQYDCRGEPPPSEIMEGLKRVVPKVYQTSEYCSFAACGQPTARLTDPSHPEPLNYLLSKVELLRNHGVLGW